MLSVHSRYGLHGRQVPFRTFYTRGFSHFVSSMTAPVASVQSESGRAGFALAGKQRRCTAHSEAHSRSAGIHLKYPNLEVQAILNDSLLQALSSNPVLPGPYIGRLYRLLQANDFDGIKTLFTAFFASIPHQWFTKSPIAHYEGYYASVFYNYFAALGLDITLEESSNAGRLDMAVRFNQNVYLFEFKVVEITPEGRALRQIKDRGYADPYKGLGQPIHLIGIEFSKTSRSVVGFEWETLPEGGLSCGVRLN